MEISYPDRRELSDGEQLELNSLKAIIERSVSDGVITKGERDEIFQVIWRDQKVTCEELELLRTLVRERIRTGEVRLDYT